MSIPGSASPLFFGAGAEAAAFQIDRSLRFNSGDSAYLNFTPSSAGNRRTFTFSCWVKRTKLGSEQAIFGAWTDNNNRTISRFNSSNQLQFLYQNGGTFYGVTTTQVFRDPGGWFHLVLVMDTTASTNTDRVKVYVNGSQIADGDLSSFSSGKYPPQNTEYQINSTTTHHIGARKESGALTNTYFDGYLANVELIDGQALAPTDFGEYDGNNVWQPIDTSGLTFGTNGFRLKFDDNSSNAALGNDSSGNDNDWTVNNLAVSGFGWPSTTWSDDISIDPGNYYLNNNNGPNGFDGNSSTYIDCRLGSGSNNTTNIIWAPTGGISGVTKIRVHSEYASHYRINEGTWTTFNSQGNYTQIYSGSAFTLTKLEVRRNDNGGTDYGHRVTAYELNDVEVRDNQAHSSGEEGIDSLIDTPTNYSVDSGNAGGNYATLNLLDRSSDAPTLSNGNLDIQTSTRTAGNQSCRGTVGVSTGKWYFECVITPVHAGAFQAGEVGIKAVGTSLANRASEASDAFCFGVGGGGSTWYKRTNATYSALTTSGATTGTVLSVAFDLDAGKVWVAKDGVWENSGNPAAGTNAQFTSIASTTYAVVVTPYSSAVSAYTDFSLNCGQRSFAYTPPTGYVSLCTQNLSDPTIADGSTAFDANVWNGDGTSNRLISTNFSPDFTWMKIISQNGQWHLLADAVRGGDKTLSTNNTNAEVTRTGFVSFDSNGFTIGDGNSNPSGGQTLVGWSWDAGSSTVSNTDGSITSSVRVNQSAGFSICTYTGSTGNQSFGHGLNDAPKLIAIKNRSSSANWFVMVDIGTTYYKYGHFNTTAAFADATAQPVSSTTVTLGNNNAWFGANGDNYVAYCWAPVEGYSAFGSFVSNNSTDGPFVYLGFQPKLVGWKNTNAAHGWYFYDDEREPSNPHNDYIELNSTNGEGSNGGTMDILSNGFKVRNTGADMNANSHTIFYMAWAEHPFKTARAR